MYYLGFDPGECTFAYSLLYVNENVLQNYEKLKNAIYNGFVNSIISESDYNTLIKSLNMLKKISIIIIYTNVVNVRGINEVETIKNIKTELKELNIIVNKIDKKQINILIEDQTINIVTKCISSAIIMHYIDDIDISNINFVNPNIKNSIDLDPLNKLSLLIPKYKTHRTALKNHSVANFEYIEKNNLSLIQYEKKKSIKNHYADATMQIIGKIYLLFKHITI